MFSRMVLRLAVNMDQDRLLLLRVSKQLLMIHLLLHHLHLRVCHRYSLVFKKVISFNSMLTSFGHLCLLEKVVSLHASKSLLVLLKDISLMTSNLRMRILAVTLLSQYGATLILANLRRARLLVRLKRYSSRVRLRSPANTSIIRIAIPICSSSRLSLLISN